MSENLFSKFSNYKEYEIGNNLFRVYLDKGVDKFCKKARVRNREIFHNLHYATLRVRDNAHK